jgi:hypothetical protein
VPTFLGLERQIILKGATLSTYRHSEKIGVQSPIIILLILLDAYTAYIGDFGRVLLQSRTIILGFYTTAWMYLRFGPCIAGILFFGTVWGCVLGRLDERQAYRRRFADLPVRIGTDL